MVYVPRLDEVGQHDVVGAAGDHVSYGNEQPESVHVLQVVDHLVDERRVGASVADERVKVFPPTSLHWAAAATTTIITFTDNVME